MAFVTVCKMLLFVNEFWKTELGHREIDPLRKRFHKVNIGSYRRIGL